MSTVRTFLSSIVRRTRRLAVGALLIGLTLLALPHTVNAQLTLAQTAFTEHELIRSSTFTSNFSTIASDALSRSNPTMLADLLWSPRGSFDIGHNGAGEPRDLWLTRNAAVGGTLTVTGSTTFAALSATTGSFSSTLTVSGASTFAALSATTGAFSSTLNVSGASTFAALSATTGAFSSNVTVGGTFGATGASTFTSTLTVNSTSASALDVAGGINAGSGNVGIVDTTGKIPAISSTYFASLSGANLTGIPESAITGTSVFARLAGNQTFTGVNIFDVTNAATQFTGSAFAAIEINQTGAAANNRVWLLGSSAGSLNLSACDDTPAVCGTVFSVARSGTTPTAMAIAPAVSLSSTLTVASTVAFSGATNVSLSGSSIDVNPGTAFMVRGTTVAVGALVGGIQGGVAGRTVALCQASGNSNQIGITAEDASVSTATDRIADVVGSTYNSITAGKCNIFIYDGTSSRWRGLQP